MSDDNELKQAVLLGVAWMFSQLDEYSQWGYDPKHLMEACTEDLNLDEIESVDFKGDDYEH